MLNINGATIGYDKTQVEHAIASLKVEAIDNTISAMTAGLTELDAVVEANWQGTSAQRFMKNMQTDYETIKTGMYDSYEILKNYVYEIVNKMDEIDQSVVNERTGA